MKKLIFTPITVFALLVFLASCSQEENDIQVVPETKKEELKSEALVKDFIEIYKKESNRSIILNSLKGQDLPVALDAVMPEFEKNSAGTEALAGLKEYQKEIRSTQVAGEALQASEIWMLNKDKDFAYDEVLFAKAPETKDEEDMETVTVYNIKGEAVELNANERPDLPIIMIEDNGYEALKLRASAMNEMLAESNLNTVGSNLALRTASEDKKPIEVTRLTSINLKDDKEPWFLGSAEIYAVVSGTRNEKNEPQVQVIAMTYLDKSGITYRPNQIMVYWEDYSLQAVNIQLFEQDSRTSYKGLVTNISGEVTKLTSDLAKMPELTALGTIASAIISAMPDKWFTNDDDEVDYFYALKKQDYKDFGGAAGNATATFELDVIEHN
ncbi:hypothetical protein FUAX_09020 [Fulvitalea axinellae]|uniref:DUF3103 family protein n=1 Tax=Fulvitalea axinellae TaxID=1182444 RepID=A0AAU9DCA2_9BACT|nr:hypothetical protein FUAX_09020 [Fulvitalea axinellae]